MGMIIRNPWDDSEDQMKYECKQVWCPKKYQMLSTILERESSG
jgi:hypothetical protein